MRDGSAPDLKPETPATGQAKPTQRTPATPGRGQTVQKGATPEGAKPKGSAPPQSHMPIQPPPKTQQPMAKPPPKATGPKQTSKAGDGGGQQQHAQQKSNPPTKAHQVQGKTPPPVKQPPNNKRPPPQPPHNSDTEEESDSSQDGQYPPPEEDPDNSALWQISRPLRQGHSGGRLHTPTRREIEQAAAHIQAAISQLDTLEQGELAAHLHASLQGLGYDTQQLPPTPTGPANPEQGQTQEDTMEEDEEERSEEALTRWKEEQDEEEEAEQTEWLQGVITDYFQKKQEEEREEEGRSASSTTVADAIASAPWRNPEPATGSSGETASSSTRPKAEARAGGAQPPQKKPRRTNPELEEAKRIGDMLANPVPGQPQPTKEEMREDLGVLLALFQTALRRLEEDDQCREEDRRRGKQACFEAMEMLADLMDMVEEGIDKAHYRQLLWQVRVRGNTCGEAYNDTEGEDPLPGEEPVHPADVIALHGGAEEAPSRTSQATGVGDLQEARTRLRHVLDFMEQPAAGEIRAAIQAIDRWIAAWWGQDEAIQVVEDSQEGRETSGESKEKTEAETVQDQTQEEEQGGGTGEEEEEAGQHGREG